MSSSDDNEYGFFSNCFLRIFIAQIINLFISLLLIKNRNDLKIEILEFFHFAISFLKMNENPITINSN